jgi:RNA polymerase sigma-70 factor (ECF subfamily)
MMEAVSELSDAQLVTSVARYSEVALAELYRRHGGAVFGLARRVLNSASDAEDVTQEIFLRLWNDPDRFDPSRGSLRSFLLAQAHGRAVDAIRSLSARARREFQEAQQVAASSYDLEHEAWDLALEDHVSKALDELPRDERRAIELAYFEGYTYVEVARSLGEPEGTIKSRIRNGMRRMRVALVAEGIEGVES